MTDAMTSKNIDLSSWDTLYIGEKLSRKVKGILCPIFYRKSYISRSSEIISNNYARNVTECLYLYFLTHSLIQQPQGICSVLNLGFEGYTWRFTWRKSTAASNWPCTSILCYTLKFFDIYLGHSHSPSSRTALFIYRNKLAFYFRIFLPSWKEYGVYITEGPSPLPKYQFAIT